MVLLASVVVWLSVPPPAASSRASRFEPQRRRQSRRTQAPRRTAQQSRRNYTNFSHLTPQHRQACDSCHTIPTANWPRVRRAGDAFPDVTDYPDHPSCINCHRQQFFVGARPQICTVCHTVVSPREGARHPFQNPSENFATARRRPREASEFGINFPHDRHQDVMALVLPSLRSVGEAQLVRASFQQTAESAPRPVDSCTICHQTYRHPQESKDASGKAASDEDYVIPPPAPLPENELRLKAYWLKRRTFKTSPTGHDSCFNCHWQEGGERPLSNDCAGCHRLLSGGRTGLSRRARLDVDLNQPFVKAIDDAEILEKWANRKAANFRHERSEHLDVGCTACHINITTINRLDVNTLDVPILTCSSSRCHGSTRSPKGTLVKEIEQRRKPDGARYACIECHMNYGREPIPPSHENTLPAPKPK